MFSVFQQDTTAKTYFFRRPFQQDWNCQRSFLQQDFSSFCLFLLGSFQQDVVLCFGCDFILLDPSFFFRKTDFISGHLHFVLMVPSYESGSRAPLEANDEWLSIFLISVKTTMHEPGFLVSGPRTPTQGNGLLPCIQILYMSFLQHNSVLFLLRYAQAMSRDDCSEWPVKSILSYPFRQASIELVVVGEGNCSQCDSMNDSSLIAIFVEALCTCWLFLVEATLIGRRVWQFWYRHCTSKVPKLEVTTSLVRGFAWFAAAVRGPLGLIVVRWAVLASLLCKQSTNSDVAVGLCGRFPRQSWVGMWHLDCKICGQRIFKNGQFSSYETKPIWRCACFGVWAFDRRKTSSSQKHYVLVYKSVLRQNSCSLYHLFKI